MPTSVCPECSEPVYVDAESEQGDHVTCEECAAKLEIVGLDPIELDLVDDAQEERVTDDEGLDAYEF
jgi:lysine biosynthesis protein LysW